MKILVTGAAGFIGFNLIFNLLKTKKFTIHGLDNLNTYYDLKLKKDRLSILLKSKKSFKFFLLDVCDNIKINNLIKKNKYDIIIHLAAQAGVRYSLKNPRTYIKNNINGFYNIISASTKNNIKYFIYASTSSVYGNSNIFPLKENFDTSKPVSFYAATKKNNEIIASSFSSLYGIQTIGLRFFTVYGPYGRPDMAHYKFTNSIINNKKLTVFNQGDHFRDFTYIDDVTSIIERIIFNLKRMKSNQYILNIGSGRSVPLMKLIKILENEIGKKAVLKFVEMQKGDVHKTYANINAISKIVNFKPQIDIKKGVKLYLKWYKKYYK